MASRTIKMPIDRMMIDEYGSDIVIIVGTTDIIEPESEGDPPATLYMMLKCPNEN